MGFHSLGLRVIDLSEWRLKLHVVSTAADKLFYPSMLLQLVVKEPPIWPLHVCIRAQLLCCAFLLKILGMRNAGLPIKGSTHSCLP